ncbi:MAG TPA: methionine ABC transporter permease [Clostridia bacterium]|nr:methionine ABC transporter permease [Clostridia bacterium]
MLTTVVWNMIGKGILETLYMTLVSTFFAYLLGLPLGIALVVTDQEGIAPRPVINRTLGILVNLLRSVPFLILLIAVQPLTRKIVGTTLGSTATIVPLVIAAAPFLARLVESSVKEVDHGVVEAAQSMGASPAQIVWKVLLPEAKPSLIVGSAIAVTSILSYSAMAGIVGGGGLGDIAIRYGYYRYETEIMLITVALLVLLVQVMQETGMWIARTLDKRISKSKKIQIRNGQSTEGVMT